MKCDRSALLALNGWRICSSTSGKRNEAQDTCSGWIAQYEILTVGTTCSQRISMSAIELSPFDIELRLRQSLGVTEVGCWKCSFPLSISPDLQFFTIASKVFHLQPDGKSRQVDTLSPPIHPRLRKSWSKDRYFGANSYNYRIHWGRDNRYIAFEDEEVLSINAAESKCIAVFELTECGTGSQKLVLRRSMFPLCSDGWVIHGFNPDEPFLLMRFGQSIEVWLFLQGMLNDPLF
jgi:hypothetical protein